MRAGTIIQKHISNLEEYSMARQRAAPYISALGYECLRDIRRRIQKLMPHLLTYGTAPSRTALYVRGNGAKGEIIAPRKAQVRSRAAPCRAGGVSAAFEAAVGAPPWRVNRLGLGRRVRGTRRTSEPNDRAGKGRRGREGGLAPPPAAAPEGSASCAFATPPEHPGRCAPEHPTTTSRRYRP
jgi:hypothetical protein